MQIRDRVVELKRVRAGDLIPDDRNWRTHSDQQRAVLRGLLAEIGFAGAILARETPVGLVIIDGHLRANDNPELIVPVLVVDVTEEEAAKLLVTLDPLGAMAGADDQQLTDLLAAVSSDDPAVNALLDQLAKDHEVDDGPTELKQVETAPPATMSWLLVGLPTVRFGEIAQTVESLALIPGIVCETAMNDTEPDDADEEPRAESQTGPAAPRAPKLRRRRKR